MQLSGKIVMPMATEKWKVGIIHSSFYKEEVLSMVEAAKSALTEAGIPETHVQIYAVPGSFEIPLMGSALAEAKAADALIGLGIIVEGQTHHARLLAEQTARGMMDVQTKYGIPFAFEVLYVNALKEAQARSAGEENKGREAAYAVLHSLETLNQIRGH